MSCRQYAAAIVELARGNARETPHEAALRDHLASCHECAARLLREQSLTSGFRALSHSVEVPDPRVLEDRLLARFDADLSVAARRTAWSARWFAAAAALVVIVGLAAAWRTVRDLPSRDTYSIALHEEMSDFVPWPGAAALPSFESGQLVRTELPATVLPLLGLSQADVNASGQVTADVLYGQDGLARAVRVIRVQSTRP